MARRGRPGKGLGHIDDLYGDDVAKERQKAILQTVSGELSVREAAKRLGLSEARVRTLRAEALQGMLDALEPKPPGRPPKEAERIEPSAVEELEHQIRELKVDLQIARARTELALTMPHVLKDRPQPGAEEGGGPQKGQKKKRGGKPPWFGDTKSDT